VRESLVAWAGDCMVQGRVELGAGRLSDQINEIDVVTFHDAILCAIDDGHEVSLPEVEVDRRELHLIEVEGHRGDPVRRKRTVEEPIHLEVGPFLVQGYIHRAPTGMPLAALSHWGTFVPVTQARITFREGEGEPMLREVVLVNRERIDKTEPLAAIQIFSDGEPELGAETPAAAAAIALEAVPPPAPA
jgi:hypothetical protein